MYYLADVSHPEVVIVEVDFRGCPVVGNRNTSPSWQFNTTAEADAAKECLLSVASCCHDFNSVLKTFSIQQ